jgi:hypothetical protein
VFSVSLRPCHPELLEGSRRDAENAERGTPYLFLLSFSLSREAPQNSVASALHRALRVRNIPYLTTNKETMNPLLFKTLMAPTLALSISALALSFSAPALAQKPNIIYIMSDDMGYGDLSGYGRKEYKTPNLDKLASQGMKFTQAYSAGSLCTPTRVGFITGRYPARTPVGLMEPLTPTKRDSAYGISMKDHPIASIVRKAGYETALIGKWHLASDSGLSSVPIATASIISSASIAALLIIWRIRTIAASRTFMKMTVPSGWKVT